MEDSKIGEHTSVDKFLSDISFRRESEDLSSFDIRQFDTIVLDADETIWSCKTPDGSTIGAYRTRPPYRKSRGENTVIDCEGNTIEIRNGLRFSLQQLAKDGKSIYLVSKSELHGVAEEQQPVVKLLEVFGIRGLFEDVVIDSDLPKSKYVEKLEDGDTVFVDDDKDNLLDVSLNTDATPVDASEQNVFAGFYKRVIVAEIGDPSKYKAEIEQDAALARDGVYTKRSDTGDVDLRIDLKRKEVVEVGSEFVKSHPEFYMGRILDDADVQRLAKLNEKKLKHFDDRIDGLTSMEHPSHVFKEISEAVDDIGKLLEHDSLVMQLMRETHLISMPMEEIDIEPIVNDSNILSKYIGGVINTVLYKQTGAKIFKVEADSLATQMANYAVYGSFDGEREYRINHKIDLVPTFRVDAEIDIDGDLFQYMDENGIGIEEDNELLERRREKLKIINGYIKDGVYMYDDPAYKEYSEPFKRIFSDYVRNNDLIESKSKRLSSKMNGVAELIVSEEN